MPGFGLARIKAEGAPAHPEDIYEHCGCKKCDARFRQQALAYYKWLKASGNLQEADKLDPWFPSELK